MLVMEDPNTQVKEGKRIPISIVVILVNLVETQILLKDYVLHIMVHWFIIKILSIKDSKKNIATITDPIAKIKALKGRTFTWKSEARMREGTHYGFVAQEVESIIPDLIVDDTGIRVFDAEDNLLPSNVITPPVGGGYAKSVDSDGVTRSSRGVS